MGSQSCTTKGCKADKAWAVVRGDKIHRITFSKSLAEYIAAQTNCEAKRITLYLGPVTDDTTLFAICKLNGWPLRVTFFKEAVDLWESDTTMVMDCKIKID